MALDMHSILESNVSWPTAGEDRPFFMAIAGGSGSGKTTIAQSVVEIVGAELVTLIQQDAYYRDPGPPHLRRAAAINYDHPDSLENELMVSTSTALRAGRVVRAAGVRLLVAHPRTETVRVEPGAVIIVDGILVLAEPELRTSMDLRVYIDTDADLRLLRRLQRDIVERGIARWKRSSPSTKRRSDRCSLQFVEPSKRYADIIVPEGYNPGAVGTVTSMIQHFLTERTPTAD